MSVFVLVMVFVPAWIVLAVIVAWGSYHFSLRDPRSTSLVKIGFAGVLLVLFGAVLAIFEWGSGILGEGLSAHALYLLFFWPMSVLGAPLCIGSILGTTIAMYRSRDR
jgi:hypothetical protein